jgi:3-oxoacyl-[acyl-carrier protein] reductase
MPSYPDLIGKVALITGASSGIGSATARFLAASGAKVVVNYWKNEKGAAETVAAITAQGGAAVAIKADVSGGAGCASLVEATVKKFGPVDILVNNAGSIGGPGAGHYAASKAAVIAFSKNVAKELAPRGVRVNCVAPGIIDTPLHDQFSTPEMMKGFIATIPMGRVGTAAEVASVIGFLCSDASSYVCGETIEINGAQLMM